jgi:hypothetical protein
MTDGPPGGAVASRMTTWATLLKISSYRMAVSVASPDR